MNYLESFLAQAQGQGPDARYYVDAPNQAPVYANSYGQGTNVRYMATGNPMMPFEPVIYAPPEAPAPIVPAPVAEAPSDQAAPYVPPISTPAYTGPPAPIDPDPAPVPPQQNTGYTGPNGMHLRRYLDYIDQGIPTYDLDQFAYRYGFKTPPEGGQ